MTKAKRYTRVMNGFIRAELQDGYLYADGNVEYFIYHSKVSGKWYAVDCPTGMSIYSADKKKDLTSLPEGVKNAYLKYRLTDMYKDSVAEFASMIYEEEKRA